MKYLILLLTVNLLANVEVLIYKDEPIVKNFVDSDWQCTAEELNEASKHFMKCDKTPVFRDCYKKMIKKHCTRKLF